MTSAATLTRPDLELAEQVPGCPSRPCLTAVLRRVGATLSVSMVIPAVLFTATLFLTNVSVAVVVSLFWFYGAMVWQHAAKRRASALLGLMVLVKTIRTAFTLATGNTFIYFLQPIVVDAVVALVFLGSLATARPVIARVAADFYPMDDELAARDRIQRLFWYLTLGWGLMCLVKCVLGYWLLETQTLVNYVVIKNGTVLSLTAVAVFATVCASVVVARKEGLFARA